MYHAPVLPWFLFKVLVISLTLQSYHSLAQDLIDQTCSQSRYKDICVETLKSDPSSSKPDVKGFATIIIDHASNTATNISKHIQQLLSTTKESFVLECLEDCSEYYLDADDQLEDVLAALEIGGYDRDINAWLQAAMADAETCENSCKKNPNQNSVLTLENNRFTQLCQIAVDITNGLAKT